MFLAHFSRLWLPLLVLGGLGAQSPVPQDLAGEWEYREEPATAVAASNSLLAATPNRTVILLRINPNETFTQSYSQTSTVYSCAAAQVGTRQGTVLVRGKALEFGDRSATLKSSDTCHKEWNFEKPSTRRTYTYTWRVDHDAARPRLVLREGNSQEMVLYRR